MIAFLDLVNCARQMRPEEVRGWIKGTLWKDRRTKKPGRQRRNENQSSSKMLPKKIPGKKRIALKIANCKFLF